jgi:Flp pilus assembly secretin CpaC
VAFVFASTVSATQAQKSTIAENLTQQSAPLPEQEANAGTRITVLPGFMKKIELQNEAESIHIGDPSVVDVQPINNRTILVQGKKIGRTSVSIVGANGQRVFTYNVIVDSLPGSKTVEVFDRKDVHNSVSYECLVNYGCGYPVVHEVKAEDLPKGYSVVKSSSSGPEK